MEANPMKRVSVMTHYDVLTLERRCMAKADEKDKKVWRPMDSTAKHLLWNHISIELQQRIEPRMSADETFPVLFM
jgi:hypothetical protein